MIPNYELRAIARGKLKGNWLLAAVTLFVAGIIGSAFSGVLTIMDLSATENLGISMANLAFTVFVGIPIAFGLVYAFMSFNRTDNINISDIFMGYKGQVFGKVLSLGIMQAIFVFLWSLLLIIPGMVKALAYSMSYYILADNPEMTWKQCLTESQLLMNGYKGQLFMLYLSFIGWALLSVFTLGIGFFFLGAYINTSVANFYERLSGNWAGKQAPYSASNTPA